MELKVVVNKKSIALAMLLCALTEIRTPVLSLKGLRPSPLDDEGNGRNSNTQPTLGQVFLRIGLFVICYL